MIGFKTFSLLSEEFDRRPGTQLGTNPGGRYTHLVSGKDYYIKFPNNSEQAKVEVASSRVYNALGIPTLNPTGKDISGRIGVITPWRDDLKTVTEDELKSRIKTDPHFANEMVKLHVASALVRNHDAVGLWDAPNIMFHKNGNGYSSIDQGGSMHFRAQGEPKEFGEDAREDLDSLRVQRRPSGQVFNLAYEHTTPEQHKAAKESLNSLTDEKIDAIINSVALDPKYSDILKKRRDSILK